MKILVIDDEELCQDLLRAMFERIGTVLIADSVAAGRQLYDANPDADIVIVDGCINNRHNYDAGPMIRHIRARGFKGPLIGASGSTDLHQQMMADGCDAAGQKNQAKKLAEQAMSSQ